jgi:hypothetical protein
LEIQKDEPDLSQQSSHDADPGRIERFPANGLARPVVPIRCVALIAFFAVQVGMHPRTLNVFVLLRGLVRPVPIALGIPPQSGEGVRESGRRAGGGDFNSKEAGEAGAWCRPPKPSELGWEFSSPATCSQLRFLGGMATTICRLSSAKSTWRKPSPPAFCLRKLRPASQCRS